MTTAFPTGLDNFTNPTPANNLSTPTVLHTDQHSNSNDAIGALEAKVGVNSSAVTSSLDYRVTQLESQSGNISVVTKNLTDAQIKSANTPYILIPATETLNYSDPPTKLFVPFVVVVTLDNSFGAYTNVDSNTQFVIAWGSDWSFDILKIIANGLDTQGVSHIYIPFNINFDVVDANTPAEGVSHTHQMPIIAGSNLDGNLQDNAMVFVVKNGGGDLGDGNSSNSLKINVIYLNLDL